MFSFHEVDLKLKSGRNQKSIDASSSPIGIEFAVTEIPCTICTGSSSCELK